MEGKVFVIGIDGGEFSLVKKWIKEGELPHLAEVMASGSHGNLRSTIPPITGAAWSSFQTGTNPGKHGAFNWFERMEDEYRAAPVTAASIQEPTLWKILNKLGKKTGVLGVPVTYPPEEVDGFLVPGLLTPPRSGKQGSPAEIIEEIHSIDPDYKFSPKEWTRGYEPEDWVKELVSDVEGRTEVIRHLMLNKDWDFMMAHFMETDQVQHFMWDLEGEKGATPLLDVYRAVDRAVGIIREELEAEDTLYIMSDHGFGPLRFDFHIDTWLLKEGYIKLKNNPGTRLKQLTFKLGLTKEVFYPVGEYMYPFLRKTGMLETAIQLASNPWLDRFFLSSQNVDWSRSLAYSHSEIGHIYLNVKGREPEGAIEPEDVPEVREELISKLKELKNPYNGKKIVGEIYRGRELYSGDQADRAPDIVFLPADMELLGKGAYNFVSHKVVSRPQAQSGHHRMEGLFMACGPQIREGVEIDTPHIMDLAPTILYNMGLPLFEHMDGAVVEDIFCEKFLLENDFEYMRKEDLGFGDDGPDGGGGNKGEEEMVERLKGLGYVS
ncbi:MAG: alkaline phosphatase family protein [Halanaerobiaceae bacterium]